MAGQHCSLSTDIHLRILSCVFEEGYSGVDSYEFECGIIM